MNKNMGLSLLKTFRIVPTSNRLTSEAESGKERKEPAYGKVTQKGLKTFFLSFQFQFKIELLSEQNRAEGIGIE